jgi:hypothetical protein
VLFTVCCLSRRPDYTMRTVTIADRLITVSAVAVVEVVEEAKGDVACS